jgi:ribose transport system substrate-binding protein
MNPRDNRCALLKPAWQALNLYVQRRKKTMKRTRLLARETIHYVLILTILLMLISCNPGKESKGSSSGGLTSGTAAVLDQQKGFSWSDMVVGYTAYNSTSEYLALVESGTRDAVRSRGGKFLRADCNHDGQAIRSTIDTFMLQGAKVIVDFNFIPELFDSGYAQELLNKGVKVISVDVKYQPPAYLYGCDTAQQGTAAAELACKYIDKNWGGQADYMVIMFLGSAGESGNVRSHVAENYFKSHYPAFNQDDIKWMDLSSGGDVAATAMTYARDFITSHPNSHKIYFQIHSDSQAVSAFAAVKQANRLDDVIIVSVDAQSEAINTIKENNGKGWIGTVAAFPDKYGEGIADYIELLMQNDDAPYEYLKASIPITIDNIYEYYP